jgi:hypothetical protein
MATFTTQKGYAQPVPGADIGQWGIELNSMTSILDNNMGGTATVSVAGSGNVVATGAQAQCLIQNLIGILTGNVNYVLPALGGFYAIENNTSGAFAVTVVTSAFGAGVVVPQGTVLWVYSDGTNILRGAPAGWQEISSTTATAVTGLNLLLPSAFRRFRLTLANGTVTTTGASINLEISIDNLATFITTATYTSTGLGISAPNTVAGASTGGLSSIALTPTLNGGNGWDAQYEISPGFSTGSGVGFYLNGQWSGVYAAGGVTGMSLISGSNAAQKVNGIGIFPAGGGTMTLTAILEGLP